MNELDALVAAVVLDRAIALGIVAVPALVLGYCAGRIRTPRSGGVDGEPSALEEASVADLALARDADAPRLLVPDARSRELGSAGDASDARR